jgi:hypothetical protein
LAADPGFCRDYARSAIEQFREAEHHDRCRDHIRDFAVWSPDWDHHYGWCLGVSRDQAWDGRRHRQEFLDGCEHRDWRDDHDDWDHHDWRPDDR